MEDKIDRIDEELSELRNRVSRLEQAFEENPEVADSSGMSEFVQSKSPSTHIEFAAAIGYYLINHDSLDPFTYEDVKDGYVECREPLPANVSDVLSQVSDKGYFMNVDQGANRYQWTLTKEGIKTVEAGFES